MTEKEQQQKYSELLVKRLGALAAIKDLADHLGKPDWKGHYTQEDINEAMLNYVNMYFNSEQEIQVPIESALKGETSGN